MHTGTELDRIVGNAFIASVPGDPFWIHVLRLVAERATEQDPLASTGPFMLTQAVETYARRDEIAILPASSLYPLTKKEAWQLQARGKRRRSTAPSRFTILSAPGGVAP